MTHFIPPRPEPLPAKPSLYRRLQLGMRSGLSLFLDGAFRIPLGRYAVPTFPWFKRRWVFTVRSPELIRQVLVAQAADYPKHDLNQYMLRHLTADNVFVTNGEAWRRQRRLVDSAFEAARIKDVFPMMREACEASIARVDERLAQGSPSSMRIDAEMTHFAADIIFRTLYSEPIPPEGAERIFAAFETFQHIAYAHGMLRLVNFPAHLLPGNRRARKAGKVIREILRQPLDRRMQAIREGRPVPDNDILAGLMAATDPETGRGFDEAELLDEVAMLFLAGHETSASGMAWTLYLLANDQEVQDRLHAEAVEVLDGRAAQFSDMKRLAFTRDVFREGLRLYPPVAFYARSNAEPQCLHAKAIEADSAIFVSPWLMQRHEAHWTCPDAFDPDRFATPEGAEGLRSAFLPFSLGPRVCVGAAFAMQEATLLLAEMARRFRFLPQPGHTPDPIARLTLRSANGVPLVVERR